MKLLPTGEVDGRCHMGWELRRGKRVYVRKVREGARVRSIYCGAGERGKQAAREDKERRAAQRPPRVRLFRRPKRPAPPPVVVAPEPAPVLVPPPPARSEQVRREVTAAAVKWHKQRLLARRPFALHPVRTFKP
ncbi:MAG: hypothetical protein LC802_06855 [Acidobacteria bacterium]|nr:hypothetical protein [Acidobacteriota bacterium]